MPASLCRYQEKPHMSWHREAAAGAYGLKLLILGAPCPEPSLPSGTMHVHTSLGNLAYDTPETLD